MSQETVQGEKNQTEKKCSTKERPNGSDETSQREKGGQGLQLQKKKRIDRKSAEKAADANAASATKGNRGKPNLVKRRSQEAEPHESY